MWTRAATLLALAGDKDGHRDWCDRLPKQVSELTTTSANGKFEHATAVGKLCSLLPGNVDRTRPSAKFLQDAMNQNKNKTDGYKKWICACLGLVAVRSAHAARRRAHELLEQATRAVEVAIEQDERAGLAVLNNKVPS